MVQKKSQPEVLTQEDKIGILVKDAMGVFNDLYGRIYTPNLANFSNGEVPNKATVDSAIKKLKKTSEDIALKVLQAMENDEKGLIKLDETYNITATGILTDNMGMTKDAANRLAGQMFMGMYYSAYGFTNTPN